VFLSFWFTIYSYSQIAYCWKNRRVARDIPASHELDPLVEGGKRRHGRNNVLSNNQKVETLMAKQDISSLKSYTWNSINEEVESGKILVGKKFVQVNYNLK